MEFAEYIKTPRLDRVTLTRPFRDPVEGVVCITGHHLIFSSRKSAGDELWVGVFVPPYVLSSDY